MALFFPQPWADRAAGRLAPLPPFLGLHHMQAERRSEEQARRNSGPAPLSVSPGSVPLLPGAVPGGQACPCRGTVPGAVGAACQKQAAGVPTAALLGRPPALRSRRSPLRCSAVSLPPQSTGPPGRALGPLLCPHPCKTANQFVRSTVQTCPAGYFILNLFCKLQMLRSRSQEKERAVIPRQNTLMDPK